MRMIIILGIELSKFFDKVKEKFRAVLCKLLDKRSGSGFDEVQDIENWSYYQHLQWLKQTIK